MSDLNLSDIPADPTFELVTPDGPKTYDLYTLWQKINAAELDAGPDVGKRLDGIRQALGFPTAEEAEAAKEKGGTLFTPTPRQVLNIEGKVLDRVKGEPEAKKLSGLGQ